MAKALLRDAQTMDDENAELKGAVRQCIDELESANQRMAQRQLRIDKLKIETRAMLNALKAFPDVA